MGFYYFSHGNIIDFHRFPWPWPPGEQLRAESEALKRQALKLQTEQAELGVGSEEKGDLMGNPGKSGGFHEFHGVEPWKMVVDFMIFMGNPGKSGGFNMISLDVAMKKW